MAISSKFRMVQYKDSDYREDTSYFISYKLYKSYWKYEISEFKDRVKMIEGCISGSIHFVMMVNEDEGQDRRPCAANYAIDYDSS